MTAPAQITLTEQDLKDVQYLDRICRIRRAQHPPMRHPMASPAWNQAVTEFLRLPVPVGAGLPDEAQRAAMRAWLDRREAEIEAELAAQPKRKRKVCA